MRAKQVTVKIEEIKKIKEEVFLLSFVSAYIASEAVPGQFLHVKVASTVLRRPFSIHKVIGNKIYILFKVKGRGTKILSQYNQGALLDIIGPLGRGFNVSDQRLDDRWQNILIGGGLGVAPLVFLAEKLKKTKNEKRKTKNVVLLGNKNKDDILCEQEFKKLGFKVYIATEDGTKGAKGTVITLLELCLQLGTAMSAVSHIYACGPKEMFFHMHKVLEKYPGINSQVSFEQVMGCGLGFCCACAIETKPGYKKVCKDGPVFDLKEIW